MLVTGDALAMAVLEARGFKQKDYARFILRGPLAGRCCSRWRYMRTGNRNAIASQDLSVKEALMVMTRARSGQLERGGCAGKLVGVFTDGDFRRHMAADEDSCRSH